MKLLKIAVIILAIGFLVVIPVVKHNVTKNEVERELEVAMYEYQLTGKAKVRERLERIAKENELDPSTVEITIDDTGPSQIVVTMRYVATYKVVFVPLREEVRFSKQTARLGI